MHSLTWSKKKSLRWSGLLIWIHVRQQKIHRNYHAHKILTSSHIKLLKWKLTELICQLHLIRWHLTISTLNWGTASQKSCTTTKKWGRTCQVRGHRYRPPKGKIAKFIKSAITCKITTAIILDSFPSFWQQWHVCMGK